MTPSDAQDSARAELGALRSELQEWTFGIRCVFAALNMLPLYYCSRALLAAPAFKSIFTDMLGSQDKLPVATRFIVEWSHELLAGVWLLAALSILLIFRAPRARTAWITTVLLTMLLLVTGHLVVTTLFEPLGQVIQNLSGGSGETPL